MLEVCLLGTSGMMPLPRRALTALMTRYNGSNLLIDCGEGTQVSIREKGWSFHSIDTICITHFHGDHVSGLPGLLMSMGNAERTEPITIIGPRGVENVCRSLMVIAPHLPFPVKFIELTELEQQITRNGYEITAFRVNHNVTCYGYSLSIARTGKFDRDRADANGVPMKLWNPLQKGQQVEWEGKMYTPDMILGEPRKGLKVTYCTDSRPNARIVENAQESDLFICEGMYGEEDKDNKAKEHKHMTFAEAATMAADAKVSELWLTHYSPSLIRPEPYMDKVKSIFPNAVAGKDRKSVDLLFAED